MFSAAQIQQFKNGDARVFNLIFEQLHQQIWAICYKYTRNHEISEDLVHDSFILLWENRHLLDPEQGIKGYLSTIARNEVFRWLKKQAEEKLNKKTLEEGVALVNEINGEQTIHAQLDLNKLKQLIKFFPEKRKHVFELVKLEELSYHEVATRLSISRDAVKDHITKANKVLKQLLHQGESFYQLLFIMSTYLFIIA